ncbi:hypothetical protein ABK040_014334 [Willaertia magna]
MPLKQTIINESANPTTTKTLSEDMRDNFIYKPFNLIYDALTPNYEFLEKHHNIKLSKKTINLMYKQDAQQVISLIQHIQHLLLDESNEINSKQNKPEEYSNKKIEHDIVIHGVINQEENKEIEPTLYDPVGTENMKHIIVLNKELEPLLEQEPLFKSLTEKLNIFFQFVEATPYITPLQSKTLENNIKQIEEKEIDGEPILQFKEYKHYVFNTAKIMNEAFSNYVVPIPKPITENQKLYGDEEEFLRIAESAKITSEDKRITIFYKRFSYPTRFENDLDLRYAHMLLTKQNNVGVLGSMTVNWKSNQILTAGLDVKQWREFILPIAKQGGFPIFKSGKGSVRFLEEDEQTELEKVLERSKTDIENIDDERVKAINYLENVHEVLFTSAHGMIVGVYDFVGLQGFDESKYFLGHYEDFDFCYRVQEKLGKKVYYVPPHLLKPLTLKYIDEDYVKKEVKEEETEEESERKENENLFVSIPPTAFLDENNMNQYLKSINFIDTTETSTEISILERMKNPSAVYYDSDIASIHSLASTYSMLTKSEKLMNYCRDRLILKTPILISSFSGETESVGQIIKTSETLSNQLVKESQSLALQLNEFANIQYVTNRPRVIMEANVKTINPLLLSVTEETEGKDNEEEKREVKEVKESLSKSIIEKALTEKRKQDIDRLYSNAILHLKQPYIHIVNSGWNVLSLISNNNNDQSKEKKVDLCNKKKSANDVYCILRIPGFATGQAPSEILSNFVDMGVDEIWVPTDFHKGALIESSTNIKHLKINVLPLSVDLEHFTPNQHKPYPIFIQQNRKFLVLVDYNTIQTFDKLVSAFFSEFTSFDNVVLYIKPESDQIMTVVEQRLQATITKLGVPTKTQPNYVLVSEEIDYSKIPSFYLAFDAIIYLPLGSLGYPHKLLEILGLGVPLITTKYGSIMDVFSDSKNVDESEDGSAYWCEYEFQSVKQYPFLLTDEKLKVDDVSYLTQPKFERMKIIEPKELSIRTVLRKIAKAKLYQQTGTTKMEMGTSVYDAHILSLRTRVRQRVVSKGIYNIENIGSNALKLLRLSEKHLQKKMKKHE